MANYHCQASGLLGGSLPWSFGINWQSASTEATIAANWNAALVTLFTDATNGLQKFMSADVTFTSTFATTLNATFHQTTKTIVTTGLPVAGTDANASLPWSIAEVITLRTNLARKNGHGRFFLPPFAEDQIAAHVIKAATITSMQTVFNAFFASMTGAGHVPFVFNRKTLKDGTLPFQIELCTFYDISNKPARQSRRVSKLVPTRTVGAF